MAAEGSGSEPRARAQAPPPLGAQRAFHAIRLQDLKEARKPATYFTKAQRRARKDDVCVEVMQHLAERRAERMHRKAKYRQREEKEAIEDVRDPEDANALAAASREQSSRASTATAGGLATAALNVLDLLDHRKLSDLKRDFKLAGRPLTLLEFVSVMSRYLPLRELGEARVVRSLCEFFRQVDVNGDGTMEWGEFTSSIVEAGMRQAGSRSAGSGEAPVEGSGGEGGEGGRGRRRSDAGAGAEAGGNGTGGGIGGGGGGGGGDAALHAKIFRRGALADFEPENRRAQIECAFYVGVSDSIVLALSGNAALHVLDSACARRTHTLTGHRSQVLCCEWIGRFGFLATSGNDRFIRFWSASDDFAPVPLVIPNATGHSLMRWSTSAQRLFSADEQGGIFCRSLHYGLNVESGMGYTFANEGELSGHTDAILDLLVLENTSMVASASLDGTVRLWDLKTLRHRATLDCRAFKGALRLAYHPEFHILFSVGFGIDGAAWNPYCAKLICALSGHRHPLVDVLCVPDSPHVVTVDNGGNARVWDIRNYACLQTILVEDHEGARVSDLRQILWLPRHQRLAFCAARGVFFYESVKADEAERPWAADSLPPTLVLHNDDAGVFLSCHGHNVKVWAESDGALRDVFVDASPHEISAAAFNRGPKKRLILGDVRGCVTVVNAHNGAQLKRFAAPFASAVVYLEALGDGKGFVAASLSGECRVYDESVGEEIVPIERSMLAREGRFEELGSISCGAYSEEAGLVALGTLTGRLRLWDPFENDLVADIDAHTSEITALCFLVDYPVLAVADAAANICLWTVRPATGAGQPVCLVRLINTLDNAPNAASMSAVTVMTALTEHLTPDAAQTVPESRSPGIGAENLSPGQTLVTADSAGGIKVWSLRSLFARWGLQRFAFAEYAVEDEGGFANGTASSPRAAVLAPDRKAAHQPCAPRLSVDKHQPAPGVQEPAASPRSGPRRARRTRTGTFSAYFSKLAKHGAAICAPGSPRRRKQLLAAGDVVLAAQWAAHRDRVRSLMVVPRFPLQCGKKAPLLISASFDSTVAFWSLGGDKLGALEQGRSLREAKVGMWRLAGKAVAAERNSAANSEAEQLLAQLSVAVSSLNRRLEVAGDREARSRLDDSATTSSEAELASRESPWQLTPLPLSALAKMRNTAAQPLDSGVFLTQRATTEEDERLAASPRHERQKKSHKARHPHAALAVNVRRRVPRAI